MAFELRSGLKTYVSLKAVVTVERVNAISLFGVSIRENQGGITPQKLVMVRAARVLTLTHTPNEQAVPRHLIRGC